MMRDSEILCWIGNVIQVCRGTRHRLHASGALRLFIHSRESSNTGLPLELLQRFLIGRPTFLVLAVHQQHSANVR